MVFTPLIASSCVGTLEPRSVTVPITDIQPSLRLPQNQFIVRGSARVCLLMPSAGAVWSRGNLRGFGCHRGPPSGETAWPRMEWGLSGVKLPSLQTNNGS